MSSLLETRHLSAGYGGRPAIVDVTFALSGGESAAVLGPNGGGKTTLFRTLLGEIEPLEGGLRVEGRPAYVPQTDRTRLDFPVSALDVALMGTLASGAWWRPARSAERSAATAALARVGLEQAAAIHFGSLSGGERQRVLIARALVEDAPILLLDEPLDGVDPASAKAIERVFDELREEGRTLLVATHDVESARGFDRVLCIDRRQVAFGAPTECLLPDVLQRTYGSELVFIDDARGTPRAAITTHHHEH